LCALQSARGEDECVALRSPGNSTDVTSQPA
jgi:hypothetical protein